MVNKGQYPALNRHENAASLAHVFVLETQHIRTVSRAQWQHFENGGVRFIDDQF
jgi:hypothetical protein